MTTDWLSLDTTTRVLTEMVAIPSVNPMDGPFTGQEPVERRLGEYIAGLFAPFDVSVKWQDLDAKHTSVFIEVPGAVDGPCALFESHMDTVPADDWLDRAFVPRRDGDLVYGRGACDDKGSLTAMVLALLDLVQSGEKPPRPVVLMAAGDEEYAQTGIKQFRADARPVAYGIFGEPTRLMPLVQHKGTVRWDITVHGRSAHTSRPELGVNAIHGALRVVEALAAYQEWLRGRFSSPLMTGPAITVTMIHGGRTRNAVPDECTVSVDFRVVPGMVPIEARQGAMEHLEALGLTLTHHDVQLCTPPLSTPLDHTFSLGVLEVCRRHAGPHAELRGEPYGTDAGWVADIAPALVLGPGDISYAHAVDERVSVSEVLTCARIYRDIMGDPGLLGP